MAEVPAPSGTGAWTAPQLRLAGVPEFPASLTRAAASTPSDSVATTAIAMIGALQFGDVARRVRAAAPQRRHHSCSGRSGAPHSGQESPTEPGTATPAAPAERA